MAKQPSLEEVVKAGKKYHLASSVLRAVNQGDATNPEIYSGLQKYLLNSKKLTPEAVDALINPEHSGDMQKNPSLLGDVVRAYETEDRKDLAEKVAENQGAVLAELDDKEIKDLALKLPDENKKYQAVQNALEDGDLNAVRKAYISTFDDYGWQKTMAAKTPHELKDYANAYCQLTMKMFISEYLSTDGKYDSGKARAYVASRLAKLSDEEKETVLADIGLRYAAKKSKRG